MSNACVVFIPTRYTHWQMFMPLVDSLASLRVDSRFVWLKDFFDGSQFIEDAQAATLNLKLIGSPRLKRPKGKLIHYKLLYHEVLPVWNAYLRELRKGAVVVAQDGGWLVRSLLEKAHKHGLKRVAMQDGFFVTTPKEFGWDYEYSYRRIIKGVLVRTPLERFINKGFGTSADHYGLYSDLAKERLVHANCLSEDKIRVIGSPRHAVFRDRVRSIRAKDNQKGFRILCLPTDYEQIDKALDRAQDDALLWLFSSADQLARKAEQNIVISLKVKRGEENKLNHYRSLLANTTKEISIEFLSGYSDFESLVSASELIITTGSTAALEAAVCKKPVIQILPPYIRERVTPISGLPIAGNRRELEELLKESIGDRHAFFKNNCTRASKELIDIDPRWDSVKETAKWLADIVEVKPAETGKL